MARGSALTAQKLLSEEAQAFLGCETASRAEVMSAIWAYIRENELKDEDGVVRCDEALYQLLGVRKFEGVSSVPKLLKKMEVFLD